MPNASIWSFFVGVALLHRKKTVVNGPCVVSYCVKPTAYKRKTTQTNLNPRAEWFNSDGIGI